MMREHPAQRVFASDYLRGDTSFLAFGTDDALVTVEATARGARMSPMSRSRGHHESHEHFRAGVDPRGRDLWTLAVRTGGDGGDIPARIEPPCLRSGDVQEAIRRRRPGAPAGVRQPTRGAGPVPHSASPR